MTATHVPLGPRSGWCRSGRAYPGTNAPGSHRQGQTAECCWAAMLAGGHVLIEDVPGVGKTTLARAMAQRSAAPPGVSSSPRSAPERCDGYYLFRQKTSEFRFRPGPIFSNVVVADEIIRATPRTQRRCWKQCRNAGQHRGRIARAARAFSGRSHPESDRAGRTFPLRGADRPVHDAVDHGVPSGSRRDCAGSGELGTGIAVETVGSPDEIEAARMATGRSIWRPRWHAYLTAIVRAPRRPWGSSWGPARGRRWRWRAGGRALAAIQGRAAVTPDDIKRLAPVVLEHRVVMTVESRLREQSSTALVRELLRTIRCRSRNHRSLRRVMIGCLPGSSGCAHPGSPRRRPQSLFRAARDVWRASHGGGRYRAGSLSGALVGCFVLATAAGSSLWNRFALNDVRRPSVSRPTGHFRVMWSIWRSRRQRKPLPVPEMSIEVALSEPLEPTGIDSTVEGSSTIRLITLRASLRPFERRVLDGSAGVHAAGSMGDRSGHPAIQRPVRFFSSRAWSAPGPICSCIRGRLRRPSRRRATSG